jgi:PAS domain S-box-containing protein
MNAASKPLDFDPYRLLVEQLTDYAIFMLDVNGFILTWSTGGERLTGYTADDIIGRHFSTFYAEEDVRDDKPGRVLIQAAEDERVEHEGWRGRKDGSRFWAHVAITAVRDQSGKLLGFGEVTRDITGRRKADEELRRPTDRLNEQIKEPKFMDDELRDMQADFDFRVEERTRQLSYEIAELEKASRIKDNFLATLSHELLTPLSAMTGWVRMLRDGRLSEAQIQRALEVIDHNLSAQKDLIEDLLNVSGITSGKLTINPQLLNPAPIIQETIESVRPSIDAKQLRLEADLDLHIDAVRLDPVRFQQIIWNLLTNAVKFTPQGGSIQVRLKRGEGQVIISVTDSGEGIAPEFLPYVFDRFRQADASRSRRHAGLGLGLSIVRHLVELHGGTVSVYSRGAGRGSTLSVQMRMSSFPSRPLKPVRTDNSQYEFDRVRVLSTSATRFIPAVLAP